MKQNTFGRMFMVLICMSFVTMTVAFADDTDVYRSSVKNNAMLVIDTSGSMSWPVYDENEDYANFMRWMRDPDGDGSTADAIAYDDSDCHPYGSGANSWWDTDASATPDNYDRIDPNRIYLVST